MPYTRLPLADFKALYPFPALTEGQYAAWAGKAERQVGENWGDDQQDATELLTAHLLASNGVAQSDSAALLAATGATSFKSGSFQATIAESVVTQRARGGYEATPYGIQFAAIQRRLFSGPVLMGICP